MKSSLPQFQTSGVTRLRGAVSLNPPGVKSSVKVSVSVCPTGPLPTVSACRLHYGVTVKRERRRIPRGLRHRSASDIMNASGARRQMAGDGEEAKRLPKRPFHGEGDEMSGGNVDESVKIQSGKKTSTEARGGKERRGKENAAVLTHCYTGGSAETKMDRTVIHGPQTREDPSIFFDEDSNHIFPVEQFFGNMDVVQDYPRRTPGSKRISRRQYRSQHYYAKEDSDDEQLSQTQTELH